MNQLATDMSLGCGNFLTAALRVARSNVDAPKIFLDRSFAAARSGGERLDSLSLAKLNELARREAAAYVAAGVKPRDPVAVSVPDGIEYLIHFIALTSLGAIAVLVNPEMKPAIAAGFIERVGAIGLVADRDRLAAIVAHLKEPQRFASSFLEPEAKELPAPFVHAPEDPVLLCHSSGTTGIPKAVTFQHHAFFHGIRYRLSETATPARRLLTALPHSHSAGIAFPMLALLRDEPVFMVKGDDAAKVLAAAESFKATTVVAFAHTFVEISQVENASSRFDLSSV
jgi:acyl-CoA synthetase (AMP-forming)/AMP-acid ligase II